MKDLKIGDEVLVKAKIRKIIFDEKGKHYQIVINGDTMNATNIDPKDVIE